MAESRKITQSGITKLFRSRNNEKGLVDIAFDELKELELKENKTSKVTSKMKYHACDICTTISFFMCYDCTAYFCKMCFQKHDNSHKFVERKGKGSKRRRVGELLLAKMRSEEDGTRNLSIYKETAAVDRKVNLKHENDKVDCFITGVCGFGNEMWAVLDSDNYCLKMYNTVSNSLQRYLRFGSQPLDVTEIWNISENGSKIKPEKTKIDFNRQRLIAVTFWHLRQIWIIDTNIIPAVKTKTIHMEKECFSIEFNEDKMFVLCRDKDWYGDRYSIYILSPEGDLIRYIENVLRCHRIPDLTICKETIYLSFYSENKVFCMNMNNAKILSKFESSKPTGICMDRKNNVYHCGYKNSTVYKHSSDQRGFERLSLGKKVILKPGRICFMKDRLFVSHYGRSVLGNTGTVIKLT